MRAPRVVWLAWLMACVGGLGLAQVTSNGTGPSSAQLPKEAALEREKAVLLDVIDRQAAAFWAKDFDRWADTWVHAPYVRRVGYDGKWKVAYLGYLLAGTPAK